MEADEYYCQRQEAREEVVMPYIKPHLQVDPRAMLLHRPALTHRLGRSSDLYQLTSIDAPAVITDTVTIDVRCGACHELVACVIESPPDYRQRRRRRRWAALGVLALALPVTIVIVLLIDLTDLAQAYLLGYTIALAVACVAAYAVWDDFDNEFYEKVRLLKRRPPHSLRKARDMYQDAEGTWRRRGIGDGYGPRDYNAEPLIEGPL